MNAPAVARARRKPPETMKSLTFEIKVYQRTHIEPITPLWLTVLERVRPHRPTMVANFIRFNEVHLREYAFEFTDTATGKPLFESNVRERPGGFTDTATGKPLFESNCHIRREDALSLVLAANKRLVNVLRQTTGERSSNPLRFAWMTEEQFVEAVVVPLAQAFMLDGVVTYRRLALPRDYAELIMTPDHFRKMAAATKTTGGAWKLKRWLFNNWEDRKLFKLSNREIAALASSELQARHTASAVKVTLNRLGFATERKPGPPAKVYR